MRETTDQKHFLTLPFSSSSNAGTDQNRTSASSIHLFWVSERSLTARALLCFCCKNSKVATTLVKQHTFFSSAVVEYSWQADSGNRRCDGDGNRATISGGRTVLFLLLPQRRSKRNRWGQRWSFSASAPPPRVFHRRGEYRRCIVDLSYDDGINHERPGTPFADDQVGVFEVAARKRRR